MKKWLVTLTLLAGMRAFAVEPTPTPTPPSQKNQEILENQSHGAIKVEDRPAVPPRALRKADEGMEHLFGLHASIGFPHPVNFGLNYVHPSHYFSAEISTGQISSTVSDYKIGIQNTEIGLRWHPWAGSFYLGALIGSQKVTAEKTETLYGQSATAKAEVKATYITPAFGWLWGAQDKGFFAGMEFGYQSPSNVKTDFSSDADPTLQATADYQSLANDVRDKGDHYGKMGLPHVVLLKIGWLF